jgi:FxsC-like protein
VAYFYVSYAHGDDDSYVSKFRRDLAAAVGRIAQDAGSDPADWTGDRLPIGDGDLVSTCRVFVALCSTRYFLNERCGREWSLFSGRLQQYEKATGRHAPALIPIVWSTTRLINEAHDIKGWQPAAPVITDQDEVSRLIRLGSRRTEYLAFVDALADRIVAVAAEHDIPPARDGLPAADNAFADLPERFADASAQFVHLVVAAGTREEMRQVRADLQFYGASGEDWAPYRPSEPVPLAAHARTLLAEKLLYALDVADLGALDERVDRARRNNDIVVLLVDAWATRLARYQQMLSAFDQTGGPAAAILVPANRDDAETAGQRRELNSSVSRTFQHSAARRDPMFRSAIETPVGFDTDLVAALEEAKNRIYQKGLVFRRPPDTSTGTRPILEGP